MHLRFKPLVARNVVEVAWHKTQQTQWNDDGSLDFHVTVSGLWELHWWVLGYGDQVEVLHPPKLREMVQSRVAEMVKTYRLNGQSQQEGTKAKHPSQRIKKKTGKRKKER